MDEVVATSVQQPRLSNGLLGLFASLAFALAAIRRDSQPRRRIQRLNECNAGSRSGAGSPAWTAVLYTAYCCRNTSGCCCNTTGMSVNVPDGLNRKPRPEIPPEAF
jgi:hypothetical protein